MSDAAASSSVPVVSSASVDESLSVSVSASASRTQPSRDRSRSFRRYQRMRQQVTEAAMDAGSFLYNDPPVDRSIPTQIESIYARRVAPSFALLKRLKQKRLPLAGTKDISKVDYRPQEPFLLMFNGPQPQPPAPAPAPAPVPVPASSAASSSSHPIPSYNLPLDLDCRITSSALVEPIPHATASGTVLMPGSRLLSDIQQDENYQVIHAWLSELRMLGISSLIEPSLIKASKDDEPDSSGHTLSASKRRELQRDREVAALIELPLLVLHDLASQRLGDAIQAQKAEVSSLLDSSPVNPLQIQSASSVGQLSLSMLTSSSSSSLLPLNAVDQRLEKLKETAEKMKWHIIRAEEAKDQMQLLEEIRPSKKLRV